ncbi:serine/threonine-protein kinase [Pyxidicoccus fallax]
MGEVFLAREESQRRACVVKKVLPRLMESPQFVGRFRDEARVMVRLAHPNIARVYAMGEVDGQLYLAMEYVQGKTLSRLAYRLRQLGRTIPLNILLHLGERMCEGLAYAHDVTDEEGHPLHLVHRDLSPANVCISYTGEVKIIDFGAAQSTLKEQQTAPRVVIGNLTYMAPEQARKRFVDRRADVYAVGALLWELVAWRPLPQRGDPVERWRRAAYPTWEPAGRFRKGVPTSLDALLMRALASEPEHRFPDAAALGAELARLKAKLTPGAGDADLARLMAAAFPREKAIEEKALQEMLRGDASRLRTEREFAAVLTPPNALAFEHSGIDAPEDFVPQAGTGGESSLGESVGSGASAMPGVSGRAASGAVARTAMYGVSGRGADAAATETLEASKVQGALDRAVAEAMESSRVRGALDPAATEALEASKVRGALDRAATETLESSKVQAALDSATTQAAESSKVQAALDSATTQALEASKVQGALDRAATEALETSKVLGAIARAEAARAMPSSDNEDTVTATAPRGSSVRAARMTRETQVGFGVDISQQVDSAAVEARRLELVRAITGEGEATVAPHPWLRDRRLLAAGLFAGACALGIGMAWALR